ncbi:hypothetical protein L5515_013293 [Caenorhabditis briggsae]|uniref:CUB domain-containing protein n=1 Tax=Caenorhabditis briggsae TaxID=6238 RepID=A0AAE9E9T7_CAEBR|nr:hypothetical protein L5515_013293 [Caenorhabditis briggsae]
MVQIGTIRRLARLPLPMEIVWKWLCSPMDLVQKGTGIRLTAKLLRPFYASVPLEALAMGEFQYQWLQQHFPQCPILQHVTCSRWHLGTFHLPTPLPTILPIPHAPTNWQQWDQRIRLSLLVDLENRYDFLQVYDGDSIDHPVLANVTGVYNEPQYYESTRNSMLLVFKSDLSNEWQGFRANFFSFN